MLLSTPNILDLDKSEIDKCIDYFVEMLKSLLGDIKSEDRVLVVGLGNRHISSDSLGAKVVGKINITLNNKHLPKVMTIAPSVMGLTGIETFDIVEGVVGKVRPTHLILIDSLCASAVERLGRSIQVTNTGICPGGGIGNKRKCIDSKLVKNIYSIGVPLLIFSSTFIGSAFDKFGIGYEEILGIMQSSRKSPEQSDLFKLSKTLKQILEDDENEMIVSIKDIEECVRILSDIIAMSINKVLGVS
jgi:spore protease